MTSRDHEPNESTDDAVWQDLVSRLEQTPSGGPDTSAPLGGPGAGHVGAGHSGAGHSDAVDSGTDAGMSDQERVRALFENQPRFSPSGPRDFTPAEVDDDDDTYHPPEPPPLGTGEPLLVLAWIGAVGGPIALLLLAMFWRAAPLMMMLGILTVFLVSVAFLILRLPTSRDHGDNGAEV